MKMTRITIEQEKQQEIKKICVKVESTLEFNDLLEFQVLVSTNSDKFTLAEILHTICDIEDIKEETQCRFASLLLDEHDAHKSEGIIATHVAAFRGLHRLLQVLVNHPFHPADPTLLNQYGETAIHCVILGVIDRNQHRSCIKSLLPADATVEEVALKSVQFLVEKNCDPHAQFDFYGQKCTAVHLAAKHKLWLLVDLFLGQNANIDCVFEGKSARELIKVAYPEWVENYVGYNATREDNRDSLINFLESCTHSVDAKENHFKDWLDNNESDLRVNEPFKGRYTLLECAIKNRLPEMVRVLIENKADPSSAIFAALAAGDKYFDLLKKSEMKLDLARMVQGKWKQTVLHRAVLSYKTSVNVVRYLLQEGEQQIACFRDWVDAKDHQGRTALYYASKYLRHDLVVVLLSFKASMFIVDNFGRSAFYYMEPEFVEDKFNDCIKINKTFGLDEKVGVVIDFQLFELPGENEVWFRRDGIGEMNARKDKNVNRSMRPEVEPLSMIACSINHKYLLQHPVVRSFLHLKWKRLSWLYWLNFSFYLAFTIVIYLLLYTIDFKKINALPINAYSTDFHNIKSGGGNASGDQSAGISFLQEQLYPEAVATLVFTIFLILRELFQLLLHPRKYIFKLENWLELLLIAMTLWLLFCPYHKEVAAFLSFAVALEMIHLMGRHPRLATYIHMLEQVTKNFFKFLLWYSMLILAFSFSFYIIFPECKDENNNDCKMSFNTVPYSIFKTLTMISAEFDVGNFQFEQSSVVSRIIFIAFVLLVSIVLVNLLNGLAVSDIQEIRKEAEVIYLGSQAKFFYDFDSYLLVTSSDGRWYHKFTRSLAKWMLQKTVLINNKFDIGNKKILQMESKDGDDQLEEIVNNAYKIAKRNKEKELFKRNEEGMNN